MTLGFSGMNTGKAHSYFVNTVLCTFIVVECYAQEINRIIIQQMAEVMDNVGWGGVEDPED